MYDSKMLKLTSKYYNTIICDDNNFRLAKQNFQNSGPKFALQI